jgi:hypothetical protein
LAFGAEITFRDLKIKLPKGERITSPFKAEGGRDTIKGELTDQKGHKSLVQITYFGDGTILNPTVLFDRHKEWKSLTGTIHRSSVFLDDIGKGIMLLRVPRANNRHYDIIMSVTSKAKLSTWETRAINLFPPAKKNRLPEPNE